MDKKENITIDDFLDTFEGLREVLETLEELKSVIQRLKDNGIEIDEEIRYRILVYFFLDRVEYDFNAKKFLIDEISVDLTVLLLNFIDLLLVSDDSILEIFLKSLLNDSILSILVVIDDFISLFGSEDSDHEGLCYVDINGDNSSVALHIDRLKNPNIYSVRRSFKEALRSIGDNPSTSFYLSSWLLDNRTYEYFKNKFPDRYIDFNLFTLEDLDERLIITVDAIGQEDQLELSAFDLAEMMVNTIRLSPDKLYNFLVNNKLPGMGIMLISPVYIEM